MIDDDKPRREAYSLQRIDEGRAIPIASFHSAAEALTVIPSLDERYRLMLGDRQIWPNESSLRHHDACAR
ncbi:hypothetical protein MesoLj131b_72010 (plasmid) [Mesorhizobium sp. 131-2-5]|uniref:hypothetical protein n=1 Tax=Mesorhizobium sp. 131-2-5 TaxID=2744519 RepID=UPI001928A050|nr:hypothetical protein [Mesorhizobium sp. 131-2-5]BCH05202.1 hypothetical protein MesoLj131b_72010 [Mesorhizobium sp. 131-2-5]